MRRLLIKVSIVAFLFIAAGIITKLWLVPMAIRKGITFEMKHYWPGYVHIEGLKFSFRGRVTLGRILLTDNQGRNRFCFENTKAFLADVLRLNFKVKNIEIASADINLFLTPEDQETSLINFSESLAWLENSRFNITQLIIENVSVTLNKNEGKIIYENL